MPKSFVVSLIIISFCLPVHLGFSDRALAETVTELKAETDNLYKFGSQQYQKGQLKEALITFQQVLVKSKLLNDLVDQKKALNNIGVIYENLGEYAKALESYQLALLIERQIADRQGEAITLNNIGLVYDSLAEYPKALDFYQQSLQIKKEIGERQGEALTLNNIGVIYDTLGQYPKALDLYKQSMEIKKELGDRDGEGTTLNNIGLVFKHIGKYPKALESYQISLLITKELGDLNGEGIVLNNMGSIFDNLGQYAKAIDYFQKSLQITRTVGDRSGEGTVLNNIGLSLDNLGKYYQAIKAYQQALKITQELGNRHREGTIFSNMGSSFISLKQYPKALDYLQQSLKIRQEIGDRSGMAYSLNNIGVVYRYLGQDLKVLDYYQKSLEIAKEIGDRHGEGSVLSNLGTSFAKLKQPELAILFYKQSINIRESIRKDIRKLGKEEQKSYLTTIEDSYRQLADLLLQSGRVMEALQIIDLLKIQELDDYLKNTSFTNSQGISLLHPEKLVVDQFSLKQQMELSTLTALNYQLASQIKQLPPSLINQVPKYLQKIPKDAVLLYPFILEDRVEIILFSANHPPINRKVSIKSDVFNELVKDFRSDLQNTQSQDVKISGMKLYNLIIKPIEPDLKQLKPTTILYAPDGILRYLPLAALYDGKQWLVEHYQINNLIAYSLFNPNSKPRSNLKVLAGAFGGKGGEFRFGSLGLPATIGEVDNIAKIFPEVTKLTERNFTSKAIQEQVKGKSIIHFATHAEFNSDSPLNSYILFGDGSKVTLSEISEWQLKDSSLVVLSACETAIGTFGALGTGTEILGFGYQVQRAGARAAIASLWTVSDGGTQLLMNGFYQNLQKQNVSILAAMRNSQLSMIRKPIAKGEVNFNHPYFWSSFVLIGSGI